ncbi:MAG: transposase [Blautia wexlerae]
MQNQIFVILKQLLNTLDATWESCCLLPESIPMTGDTVTFHYNRHEDNKYVVEKIPALDFISRLIQHIPETQFKMIRYYGIYARHRENDKFLFAQFLKKRILSLLSFNKWRRFYHKFPWLRPFKIPTLW